MEPRKFIRFTHYAAHWTVQIPNPGRVKRFLLFSKTSRPALRPAQPLIQWVPGFFLGVRAAGT